MPSLRGYTRLVMLLIIAVAVQSKSVSPVVESLSEAVNNTIGQESKNEPRSFCGVDNNGGFTKPRRWKRYAIYGNRWSRTNLTYKIVNYPSYSNITKTEVDTEIARAFSLWSTATDFTFTRLENGNVDIEIRFEVGYHGECGMFDGPNGVMAHASYPQRNSFVHFDDQETWTVNDNLFAAAAHEIGHTLGLFHSNVSSAVMFATYNNSNPIIALHADDIAGIRDLYARKAAAPDKELCRDPKIYVIFSAGVGEIYVFKGDLCYKFIGNSMAEGYPQRIDKRWKGLPENIDAAYRDKRGVTYFFKNNRIWAYHGTQLLRENMSMASDIFPKNLDALMFHRHSNTTYFTTRDEFHAIDFYSGKHEISRLSEKGLPNNLDAAFEDDNGNEYFFKGNEYYRFDNKTNKDDANAIPPYPRPIAQNWFGC